jgi:hypothetical protein
MAETKHILILANSIRAKKFCVAGKEVTPKEDGKYDIGPWIRLADAADPQGAVAYGNTISTANGSSRAVRPLDIIKVTVTGPCGKQDHPEDWFFDTTKRWEIVNTAVHANLTDMQDTPTALWHDGSGAASVSAGYVRQMGKNAATLYLLKAPKEWHFLFWQNQVPDFNNPGQIKIKKHRELSFQYAGQYHEFSVTDPNFTTQHKIYNRMTDTPQLLKVPDPVNVFFCLSLTPEFNNHHYKIGATVFEP